MSSSAKRKLLLRRPVALDLGCSCRRTKLAYLFSFPPSKPKTHYHSAPNKHQHPPPHHPFWSYYPFSPTTATTSPFDTSRYPSSTSATTPSPYDDDPASSPFSDATWATKPKPPADKEKLPAIRVSPGAGRRRPVAESVAVVKDSQDPYMDFGDSMLQMILEKEIYAWEDLRELLHRFLALNSPCHHDAILRAFSEIYNIIFAAAAST
ncbi:hypothetical protein Taro_010075 [Colocasia esculenta]|uniref:Transcription repressor n=1 Tax=Colocasia esculenta TaxID=4460 RepID=A0A843U2A2_COLES|nr:hypothetical protein [Colocasia esculenta]